MSELAFLSATQIAAKIRGGEISAEEALRHYFDRIDRYDGALNAVILQWRDQALDAARAADAQLAAGQEVGPLHGVPMTIKESYHVAGTPATRGYPEYLANVAVGDAVAVQRFKQAGVVLFGKTNVPVALGDLQSYNDIYGVTNNPWDVERTPGGSSGGSAAALAAGLTGIEAGSDIGGSIRNPAHFCGVYGHKPTHDLACPLGHSLDEFQRSTSDLTVVGPLARSAEDLAVAMQVMAGPDEIGARGVRLDLPQLGAGGLKGLRVAVWHDEAAYPVSEETAAHVLQVADACTQAGAQVSMDARPGFDPQHAHETYNHLLQAELAARLPDDEFEGIREYLGSVDMAKANPRTIATMRARTGTFREWKRHNEARHKMRWAWHEFFRDHDVVLMPVTPTAAFPHDHSRMGQRTLQVDDREIHYLDQIFWAGLASSCYLPSTIIPTGVGERGLPIGAQIVGPEFGDLITIGVAQVLEREGLRFESPPGYP